MTVFVKYGSDYISACDIKCRILLFSFHPSCNDICVSSYECVVFLLQFIVQIVTLNVYYVYYNVYRLLAVSFIVGYY